MPHSRHTYSEVFLHVTWHCQESRPLLRGELEPFVHGYLQDWMSRANGVQPFAVGGTDTHLHLAFRIEPDVLISELIGQLKGSASHAANRKFGKDALTWQRGYGVVSFARSNLNAVTDYIARQREHHSRGTTRETLETITRVEDESGDKRAEACLSDGALGIPRPEGRV